MPVSPKAAAALITATLMFASPLSHAATEDTAKPRPIPFPEGTYVADVDWPLPAIVKAEAGRIVVEFPTDGRRNPLTCIISQALDLGERSAIALARDTADLSDLSRAVITDLSVGPQVPVVFMTVQRTKLTSTAVATFRDAETSFVCLSGIAGTPSGFRRAVTELATSLRPARPAADVSLVRLCRLRLDDGSVGFERWEVSKHGRDRSSAVTSSLAYRHHDGVDFMELDAREAIDPLGRIKQATLVRMVAGKPQVRSLIRRREGASYDYEVVTSAGSRTGHFLTQRPTGLPSSVAVAKRIRAELVSGRVATFAIEIWDPFSPHKELSQLAYSLEARSPLTIDVAQGARHSRQLVEDNGFVKRAETILSGNEKLVSECETQRGAL